MNVHVAAIWTIAEVFRDKYLLQRIREELEVTASTDIHSEHGIDTLLACPLLQSVYAEVLRLRVEAQSVFTSERQEIGLNEWRFLKGIVVLVPTGVAHRDESFWSTRDGKYPVGKFWSDRFPAYPGDTDSDPRRRTTRNNETQTSAMSQHNDSSHRGQPNLSVLA